MGYKKKYKRLAKKHAQLKIDYEKLSNALFSQKLVDAMNLLDELHDELLFLRHDTESIEKEQTKTNTDHNGFDFSKFFDNSTEGRDLDEISYTHKEYPIGKIFGRKGDDG